MAGPTAGVWFKEQLGPNQLGDLETAITQISDKVKGSDFWPVDTTIIGGNYRGEGRPFFWQYGFEFPDAPEIEEELVAAKLALEWKPVDELLFAAMCNQDCDHHILAELCLYVAEKWQGIIVFGGDPFPVDADPNEICHTGLTMLNYADQRQYKEYCSTPQALKCWLSHPHFRMVK